jgi:hypothetical protein
MGPNGSDSPELASFFASASICITPVAKRLASQALLIRGGNILGQLRHRRAGLPDPSVDGDLRSHVRDGKPAHNDRLLRSSASSAARSANCLSRGLPCPLELQLLEPAALMVELRQYNA